MNFDYRYPGSRPFEDNEHDRLVFFAREQEKQSLFHLLMSERLSVLFAKSGIGKTSLIHAGLNHLLREKGFIPLVIRFHADYADPFHAVYQTVEDLSKKQKIECIPGLQNSLWEYFKTVEFWNSDDVLLSPVLILDQFEDFFAFYPPETRKAFIKELADLVRNRIPVYLCQPEKPMPYSETPPDVKILISIREDYLGLLEEMADDIPHIFQNLFRLLPLKREQAKEAIVKPAELKDERIQSPVFRYENEALETILEYLCKRKERDGIKIVNEVEPFQLQLICRHIENGIAKKSDRQDEFVVKKEDVNNLPDVLQKFYEDQLNQLGKKEKKNITRLCEKSLISVTDRRLSIEQEEIERNFKVSKTVLEKLVNSRLLRAESRVGSVYYELSHDTLIEPVRNVQKNHQKKQTNIKYAATASFIVSAVLSVLLILNYYQKSINERVEKMKWEALTLTLQNKQEEAIKKYEEAIKIAPKNAYLYFDLGNVYKKLKEYGKAKESFQKAIELDPKDAYPQNGLGRVYYDLKEYGKAEESFQKAIELDPKDAYPHNGLGSMYFALKDYGKAEESFQKAIELDPKFAYPHNGLGNVYRELKDYGKAKEFYQKAIDLDPESVFFKGNFARLLIITGDTDKALYILNEVLKKKDISPEGMLGNQFNMVCALLIENRPEAFAELEKLIQYHQSLSEDYEKGWNYEPMKNFITGHNTLAENDKTLLLKLANALESPKAEADIKLKEIAAEIDK